MRRGGGWERIGWTARVALIAAAAALVRLALVAVTDGGDDLRIYAYFGGLALEGANPYAAPADGPIAPTYADSPPLEFALFAGLLALHDAADTLRVAFVGFDVATILLIGLAFPRSEAWRLRTILFYAFNPFVLAAWTAFSEDKTLLFLLLAATLLALERGRLAAAWAGTAALAALKFLGTFFAPLLALHTLRERGARGLLPIGAFALALAASSLLWLPESLDAFAHRRDRLEIDPPIHASPMLLLSRAGLYAPWEAQLLMAGALLAVLLWHALGRLDVRDGVVLSLLAGYLFLPDAPSNRVLLVTLPFLLVLSLSRLEWAALWACSLPAAGTVVTAVRDLPAPLEAALGEGSTLRHVLWVHLPLLLVLTLWVRERRTAWRPAARRGRA